MSQREFFKLGFEKGIIESVEPSMAPDGFGTELENWVPEPLGNLRCRTGWRNGATTGLPSLRAVRGVGHITFQSVYAVPSRRQSASSAGASTVAAPSWSSTTLAGSALILIVGACFNSVYDVPSGWALIRRKNFSAGGSVAIYSIENAGARSGAETVTRTSGDVGITAHVFEYVGLEVSGIVDQQADAEELSTSPTTGTTATTTQSAEVWLGAIECPFGPPLADFTSPTNGFSFVHQTAVKVGPEGKMASLEKVVTATGAAECSVTATNQNYAGIIVTLRVKVNEDDQEVNYLVADSDTPNLYHFHYISKEDLETGGAWIFLESVSISSSATRAVAFASGLLGVIYTHPRWSAPRRWNGGSAAAVTGGPAGRCIAFHKNRFFVGGRNDQPSRVWWTQPGDYTRWWDDGAGESSLTTSTNYVDVDRDDGESTEDLLPFSDGLLIAKRTSLHFLQGSGPDSFQLEKLNLGGGAPGRSLCQTPYGVVIAGEDAVYMWSGGGVEVISKPIEETYAITGDFVTTAFVDGLVYVCDEGTGKMYVFNAVAGTWHIETVNSATERPAVMYSLPDTLLFGPQAATTKSLLNYRAVPQTRDRDDSLSEIFRASTAELVLVDPERVITPLQLHFQLRQHGGNAGQTGLTVTPYYDGVAKTARTIPPQAAAGLFRKTIGVGEKGGYTTAKYVISQTVGSSEQALMDVEAIILELDIEESR